MRKSIFILSVGLAMNCQADTGNSKLNAGFFTGMHAIFDTASNSIHSAVGLLAALTNDITPLKKNDLDKQQEAITATDSSQLDKAIPLYQSLLEKYPNSSAARIGLIRTYIQQNNYPAAKAQLDIYKQKFGEDTLYQTQMVAYYTGIGENAQAKTLLDSLLKKDPTSDTLLDLQAELNKIAAKMTPALTAQINGNYPQSITLYQQQLAQNPTNKTDQIGLIRSNLLNGNYPQGKKLLDDYKAQNGDDSDYETELARYYALSGQSQQALTTVAPLIQNDPYNEQLQSIKTYAETHHEVNITGNTPNSNAPSEKNNTPSISAAQYERMANRQRTPAAYVKAADAYSEDGNDKKALAMINKAVDLNPTDARLLMKRADIANSLDDQLVVFDTYTALYVTNPNNKKVILGLARAASRLGKTDESTRLYSIYTSRYPTERTPWIEYAYNESWSGNDRGAVRILDYYRVLFGATNEYLIARVRIVASADRPREALCIAKAIYPKYPRNYDLNYGMTQAYYFNNQPTEMFNALARVNRLDPGSDETDGLNQFIWTPYRNNVGMTLYDSFDSDTVKIAKATFAGQYYLSPTTFLLGSLYEERLSASIWSGLNPVEGGHAVEITGFNVGVNHRFNPIIALQGEVGAAHVNDGNNAMIYQGDALIRATDTTHLDLMLKRNYYDESARAVSLDVTQNLYQATLNYQPCLQCYFDVIAGYGTFSDNNTMRSVEITPAANIIATERWNIRLGVDGQWQGFSRKSNDGYYDPFNYKFYSVQANIDLKQSDNIEYEFNVGLGTQRDETYTTYSPAYDISATGFFGIYQDWYLEVIAAASTRGRSIIQTPNVSQYRVYSFSAEITRRLN